ncbi:MAG: DNA (cytosine-5-)-methyltransferase [Metamycoplasmataceae bacterium]
MKELKFIDLFAGLGGFRVALENIQKKLGFVSKCVFVSEIDKEVIKTYQANFKDAHNIINIRDLDDKASQCPEHDILFAGFPCQTFSNAGKKLGFIDEIRGTLFFDIVKILKNKKPKYILLENVKHLVTHDNGKTWNIICEVLQKIGYIIPNPQKPIILSPDMFGIPQDRKRVFIPGVLRNKSNIKTKYLEMDFSKYIKKEKVNFIKNINKILDSNVPKKYYLNKANPKDAYFLNSLEAWGEFIKIVKFPENKTLPVIWLYDMKNPQIKDDFAPWRKKYLKDMNDLYKNNKKIIDSWMKKWNTDKFKLREQKFEWQAGKDSNEITNSIITLRQSGIRCKRKEKFPTLVAMAETTLIYDKNNENWRHITPREAAKLQNFPNKYKLYSDLNSENKDFYSYKQLGNSINVEVVSTILKELLGGKYE